jgi:hypothetical protein
VKPASLPPFYDPSLVADAILYVAEHPTRDFLVGDAARAIDVLQRLSPSLVDSILERVAFRLQRLRSRNLKMRQTIFMNLCQLTIELREILGT